MEYVAIYAVESVASPRGLNLGSYTDVKLVEENFRADSEDDACKIAEQKKIKMRENMRPAIVGLVGLARAD